MALLMLLVARGVADTSPATLPSDLSRLGGGECTSFPSEAGRDGACACSVRRGRRAYRRGDRFAKRRKICDGGLHFPRVRRNLNAKTRRSARASRWSCGTVLGVVLAADARISARSVCILPGRWHPRPTLTVGGRREYHGKQQHHGHVGYRGGLRSGLLQRNSTAGSAGDLRALKMGRRTIILVQRLEDFVRRLPQLNFPPNVRAAQGSARPLRKNWRICG